MEYQRSGEEFERFLTLARENLGLSSRNQTYTVVQAVLLTFRRRLDFKQAIKFAGVLPPVVRAIFVADWNLDEPVLPFGARKSLAREVQAFRQDHNFAPDSAIADIAAALWQMVDTNALRACLDALPRGSAQYWMDESCRDG